MKRQPWIAWLALLAVSCQGTPTTVGASRRLHPSSRPSPGASLAPGPAHTPVVPVATIGPDAARVIGTLGLAVDLIGKVKLISDKGLGIISNNSGGLISDKGLGLISNNGGSIVANNGGGLVGPKPYRVRAEGVPDESLLADATIRVLDGDGKVLVGADNQPITATTDQTGTYHLSATLPDENLVLRIRLFNGGELSALLTRTDAKGQRSLDVDTASSLGASFVLERYVQGRKDVYAKLPNQEATKLQTLLEAARGKLSQIPSYQAQDLVKATDGLQGQTPALQGELETIKTLLLGQSNLGSGLLATQVTLSNPRSVYRDAAGTMYIAESIGRIRRVDPQGHISVYAGLGGGPNAIPLGLVDDMAGLPDGTLYIVEHVDKRVRKLTPDGQIVTVAGGGKADPLNGGKAANAQLGECRRVAVAPDGTVYISQLASGSQPGGILAVDPAGTIGFLPCPSPDCTFSSPLTVAVGTDGTPYTLVSSFGGTGGNTDLKRYDRTAKTWKTLTSFDTDEHELYMSTGADGKLYVNSSLTDRVLRIDPLSPAPAPAIVAGGGSAPITDGQDALAGAFPHPRRIWRGADGAMLVVCAGDGTVREVSPGNTVRRLAGSTGLTQLGNVQGLALNAPSGLAVDPAGNLVFSDSSSHTIKRLNGSTLELIAGNRQGFADGPAATAKFNVPSGLAYGGGSLYVLDGNNYELRKVASGVVTTVAGSGAEGAMADRLVPARSASFGRLTNMAVDAKGRPWFGDATNNQILRLNADGQVEVVAGALGKFGAGSAGDAGDGGPANQALLNTPGGMAFDAAGNLYFADSANLRIRKIATDGTMSTFAGVDRKTALPQIITGHTDTGDVPARSALLVGPSCLCFDAAGAMYVAEVGSGGLALAAGIFGGGAIGLPFTPPAIAPRIRKITPDGTVSIVTGPGGKCLTDTFGDNALVTPVAIAIDGQGRLAIADTGANQIKIVPAGSF